MAALLTPYATLSFPTLFTPKPRAEGGEPVYSCALLFDGAAQKSKEYKAMQDACVAAFKEKFPGASMNGATFPFRDAGEKADKYQGYEPGVMYINPWTKNKPGIVDARLQDVLMPDEVYAGQLVRAQIAPFAWINSGKKGVSFGLNHIQIVANRERIDGRVAANKAFSAIEDMEETEDAPF
jgi:Protein of unknown function (DUF2815)